MIQNINFEIKRTNILYIGISLILLMRNGIYRYSSLLILSQLKITAIFPINFIEIYNILIYTHGINPTKPVEIIILTICNIYWDKIFYRFYPSLKLNESLRTFFHTIPLRYITNLTILIVQSQLKKRRSSPLLWQG